MTLRKWALCFLLLSAVTAFGLTAVAAQSYRFYTSLIAKASKFEVAARHQVRLWVVRTEVDGHCGMQVPASDSAGRAGATVRAEKVAPTAIVERSKSGHLLRSCFYHKGMLLIDEERGAWGNLVRRDLYAQGKRRVRQYYDPEGNGYKVEYIDANDQVIHTDFAAFLPPPGWVYP